MTTGPSIDQIGQIAPLEIVFLDELDLPIPVPLFQLLLALDGILCSLVRLDVDKPINAVFAGKFRTAASPVLFESASQAVRDADIQRAVPPARQDVHIVRHDNGPLWSWVPAFAGTTEP
jgi:hypothetical protein